MINTLKNLGEPASYADIAASLLQAIGVNDPTTRLNASRERSFRRALNNLVRLSTIIEIPGHPVRYSLHPLDLNIDAEWAKRYRASIDGKDEVAKAIAISMVKRMQLHPDHAAKFDVVKGAAQILQYAFMHLAAKIDADDDEQPESNIINLPDRSKTAA